LRLHEALELEARHVSVASALLHVELGHLALERRSLVLRAVQLVQLLLRLAGDTALLELLLELAHLIGVVVIFGSKTASGGEAGASLLEALQTGLNLLSEEVGLLLEVLLIVESWVLLLEFIKATDGLFKLGLVL